MSTRDRILQGDFQIFIRGVQVPNPMQVLAENPLLWELLEAAHTAGYAKPTLIQSRPTCTPGIASARMCHPPQRCSTVPPSSKLAPLHAVVEVMLSAGSAPVRVAGRTRLEQAVRYAEVSAAPLTLAGRGRPRHF